MKASIPFAQQAPDKFQGYEGEWNHVSEQLVALVEAMPPEKFAWRPATGVPSTRMISEAERNFAIRQLDQSGQCLIDMLSGLAPNQLLYRPDRGRWSIAQNVEHLVIVEKRVLAAIERLLREPPDLKTQCSMSDAEVIWRLSFVVERIQAPELVVPTLRYGGETLLKEFQMARQNTRGLATETAGDLRHHFINHFIFGDLDCYQWLLLIGAHCNRHYAQCQMVSVSRDFPTSDMSGLSL